MLNVAAVFLVSAGSGLVLTLAGVFKDILLITGSVLIFGSSITPLQVLGESMTTLTAYALASPTITLRLHFLTYFYASVRLLPIFP